MTKPVTVDKLLYTPVEAAHALAGRFGPVAGPPGEPLP